MVTTTYAYSLHVRGKTKEAIATLETLKPETLEDPPVALYYGVILASGGQTNRAGK